ncbi:hypothetical protein D9756_009935 [Leucocoprinus leucothites]|uniref:Uncharacterized protein n=1 Tax=Leucocoprinus leucothites TaxID=201217 RepID=A0A8H5CSJ5_9AGAR|nr:hypothetical protein D9756_009935 [Leucoagaricus leucothites]
MANGIPDSYRPDESQAHILNEHTYLQGAFLTAIAYGIEFILFVMTCYALWKRRAPENRRQKIFFIVYISIIFASSTLYMAALLQFTQLAFIDGRNIPGGPYFFENFEVQLPISQVMNIAMLAQSWLCDIINLWRSYVIYQGCRISSWLINTIPMLLYLSIIGIGIMCSYNLSIGGGAPGTGFFTFQFLIILSLGFNVLVTLLLVLRLLIFRRRIIKTIGSGHGSEYASLAAMIVESASLYSLVALLLIAVWFSPKVEVVRAVQIFLQLLPPVQGISTLLIFYRVAKGKGWTNDTYKSTLHPCSTLRFAADDERPEKKDPIGQRSRRSVSVLDISFSGDGTLSLDTTHIAPSSLRNHNHSYSGESEEKANTSKNELAIESV